MNTPLRILCAILGVAAFVTDAWLIADPLGEFNDLAVLLAFVTGCVGIYGAWRG